MKKTRLVIAGSIITLSGALMMGTLAYFQDTDTKTNTFTAGKVAITLTEPNWDLLGEDNRVLVPGRKILKDPTIVVQGGSEASFIRVEVQIPPAMELLIEEPVLGDRWSQGSDDFYYYEGIVEKSDEDQMLPAVFEEILVLPSVTGAELATLSELDLNIVVNAHAIQAHGFEDADEAWKAFAP